MSRGSVFCTVVFVTGAALVRAEPVELSSLIDHVTHYPEWACVTRSKAEVDLPGGQVEYPVAAALNNAAELVRQIDYAQ